MDASTGCQYAVTILNTKVKVFGGLVLLLAGMAALLFVPAGTLNYWQAWIFLAVYFGWSLGVTLYLVRRDPVLLQRRMRGGPMAEKVPAQKIIMSLISVGFIGLLTIPALDHRFTWSRMPAYLALGGDVLVTLGYLTILLVLKVNSFSSSTIELAADQKVISTGPYALVRHPMYAGALVMLLGMPIALGSWWGVLVFVGMIPLLMWRLLDEEKFLGSRLAGYLEYQSSVRFRLLPGVW